MLPAGARDGVTFLSPTDGGVRVESSGDGAFTCLGDEAGDDRFSVSCFSDSLAPFLDHQRMLRKQGLRGPAFRERLCEDVTAGIVSLPNRGLIIEASGQLAAGADLPDSMTVYHLLQQPDARPESLGLPAEEPRPGWPFLHHSGTCDAHVMWSERRYPAASH